MSLRLVYRSCGGENRKNRPTYYSKLLGLVSFLRAAELTGAEPVFVNDGPIPEDRLCLMRAAGEIVELSDAGLRGSYLAALRLATSSRWEPDDVVWFSEDDYLYLPDALTGLMRAAEQLPDVDYFALYGTTPTRAPEQHLPNAHRRPPTWRDRPARTVDGHAWVQIPSTTSSFGARVGVLTEDLGIFRFCMVPHRNMLRDHDTCVVLQGFPPYAWREIARHAVGVAPETGRHRLWTAALAPFEVATNLRAHRRPERRRLLFAADPNLATHMEAGLISPGTGWRAVADDALAWGRSRGMVGQQASTP